MESQPKKSHNHLDLKTKVEIIEMSERSDFNHGMVIKSYGISQPTLWRILKNKEKILKLRSNKPGTKKSLKNSPMVELDEKLYTWIVQMKDREIRVTGNMIKQKAKEFYEEIDYCGAAVFKFSNGWLHRFRERMQLMGPTPNRRKSKEPKNEMENPINNDRKVPVVFNFPYPVAEQKQEVKETISIKVDEPSESVHESIEIDAEDNDEWLSSSNDGSSRQDTGKSQTITPIEALCHLTDLKDYAAIGGAPETIMCALHELESYFWREKLKKHG